MNLRERMDGDNARELSNRDIVQVLQVVLRNWGFILNVIKAIGEFGTGRLHDLIDRIKDR